MESGNLPKDHDELIELVACPESMFLYLFSQQQLQVKIINVIIYVFLQYSCDQMMDILHKFLFIIKFVCDYHKGMH